MKTHALVACALALAALLGSCSQVLGLKEPTIDELSEQIDSGTTDTGPPACVPSDCPYGCDPDAPAPACRPAKLWVYATTGLYLGNDFGGKDNTVRATSDALCLATANDKYPARACGRSRTHAVLFVSDGDSIPLMTVKYGVPTDAPVHRADDDARVFASWNDLIDTTNTKPPAVPVTTATSGRVWSGALGTATCASWTSSVANQTGTQGDTKITSANWLSRQGAVACDQLAKLLCICWTGGE